MTDGNGSSARRLLMVIMMGLVLMGVAVGTAAYSKMSGEMFAAMSDIFASDGRLGYGDAVFRNAALQSFGAAAAFLLAAFLLGFGTVYQPLTAALMLFRGVGIGAVTAHIYCTAVSGSGSVLQTVMMFVPDAAAVSFIAVVGAAESVIFSGQNARILFLSDGAAVRPQPDVRLYLLRFAVLFAAAALWALINGLICAAVSSYL